MWEIHTIRVGEMTVCKATAAAKISVTAGAGEIFAVPCYVRLLRHMATGRPVLVDAGPPEDTARAALHHDPITRTEGELLHNALAAHGLRPEDIDTVILTSLHWDNAYGITYLPGAKVVVQRDELRYAAAPYPIDRECYDLNDPENIPFFGRCYRRFVPVSGDTALEEGVKLVHLPGHSPGSQGVLVDGLDKRYLITGDAVFHSANWRERIPAGIRTDTHAAMETCAKIERLGAAILPSHEDAVLDIGQAQRAH